MKDEGRMLKDEGLRLKGVLRTDEQTDEQTDICDCRVAFATEKLMFENFIMRKVLFDIT